MWHPIDTAPRDGTRLLLLTPKGRIADGFWSLKYNEWYWIYDLVEPTHWTPLPDLPSAHPDPSVPGCWKQLVQELVRELERNTCAHEETHRGGFNWEICDMCGAKWADDKGGKPEFKWPDAVEKARAMLAAAPEVKP